MEKENIVYQKAYRFAIRIVKVYQFLTEEKKEFVIIKQLLKSSTSIDGNISEANGAISKSDFSNIISNSYKECLETKYWLSLIKVTSFIEKKLFESIYTEADEIGKILFSILKSTLLKRINHCSLFIGH